jgi:hypothetical protein
MMMMQAIVVLTDGMPNFPSEATKASRNARALGIEIFAVGFGSQVSIKEMHIIVLFF